jgi:hypothetical protein
LELVTLAKAPAVTSRGRGGDGGARRIGDGGGIGSPRIGQTEAGEDQCCGADVVSDGAELLVLDEIQRELPHLCAAERRGRITL